MKSVFLGLSLISAAAAQVVVGYSSVLVTSAAGSGDTSSAPATTPAPYPAVTLANGYTSTPAAATPDNAYAAPPSQYTAPPAPGQDFYQYMPYNSWSNGGYKQLQCGYGYQKQSDGTCTALQWVSDRMPIHSSVIYILVSISPRSKGVMQQSSLISECIPRHHLPPRLITDSRNVNDCYNYGQNYASTVTVTNYVTEVIYIQPREKIFSI